jgi:hypothetical protein
MAQTTFKGTVYKAEIRPGYQGLTSGNEFTSLAGPVKPEVYTDGIRAIQKFSFSSSLNCNGLFSYEEKYLTTIPEAGMVAFGNRAGGPYGNTGNDLKFKFTVDQGVTWDSTLFISSGDKNYRYPCLIAFNPDNSTDPEDMFAIVSGPVYGGGDWSDQFFGSTRLDGEYNDINFEPIEPGTFLNHMNIDLYCSPDGHITVASQRMNGTSGSYTYHGWEVLNGTFNAATRKVDWQVPFLKVEPVLGEEGRIDASRVVWSADGSIGYLLGIATDADPDYNPYGVGWPVIYKSTDHGVTWEKEPPFDFSTIAFFKEYLYPTRVDTNLIIPRWYNKYVGGNRENGAAVDINGNLHLFGQVRSTMSVNPDSIDYFYDPEAAMLFDVYMKTGGTWDAYYIDTLASEVTPDPGSYGISWDHQMQMAKNADGSRLFCVWTDTEEMFGTENTSPDIKGIGIDVVNALATPVKNFTKSTTYWGENFWMRLADKILYDAGAQKTTLPVTTSIPGSTSEDPLVHQYCQGLVINDDEFELPVGIRGAGKDLSKAEVSANYPNPFHGSTSVKVTLTEPASVVLEVSTITGRILMVQDKGLVQAGSHQFVIDGSGFVPGLYFCKMIIDGIPVIHKMTVR